MRSQRRAHAGAAERAGVIRRVAIVEREFLTTAEKLKELKHGSGALVVAALARSSGRKCRHDDETKDAADDSDRRES